MIYFNASNPSIDDPFVFDSNDDVVIATTYIVNAGGTADIKTTLKTLASADEDLTQIISKGEVKDDKLGKGDEFMTFKEPVKPTEAPTEAPIPTDAPTEAPIPTDAPTEAPVPTDAPTEAPVPTEAPTEAPQYATITIYGFNGQFETKQVEVDKPFDVYTYLNASELADGGKIASLNASQTYTDSIISLNSTAYPILGSAVVENKDQSGKILYLASTPDGAFVFNSDDDVMIKTTYTVTAPGEGEVRNAIQTMAADDGCC